MSNKKQLRSRVTQFSSEDSQNTDYSMDSSLEIAESTAQKNMASKFNQLRESMNQLFLANPELAEEIKFDKFIFADEIAINDQLEPEKKNAAASSQSPLKRGISTFLDNVAANPAHEEPVNASQASNKFWGVISKEMTKPQKNSKMPTLNQVNHILNIFKSRFDRSEVPETNLSPSKLQSAMKKKGDFRIQSAKVGSDKTGKLKDSRSAYLQTLASPQNGSSQAPQEEEEDGVTYYSFRKKMHLKLKQKRMEIEALENEHRKELEAERNKAAKEQEERQIMTTLAELDDELMKKAGLGSETRRDSITMKFSSPAKQTPKTRITSRKNSLKHKTDIFERLTKDPNQKTQREEEEEEASKRQFISPFAESLYKDMKAFGDPEAFKKIAYAKIANYKKEFREKMTKQKQMPSEGLKFTKEKSRYLNMFVPDFEKTSQVVNKEAVFAIGDVMKDGDEWKETPEHELLGKFQKMFGGNILEFWQDTKDLNN